MRLPSREEAWRLFTAYTESDSLRKHGRAVEHVMQRYASRFGDDEDLYARVGLLHDFDYEKYPTPEEHPFIGAQILKDNGYPDEIIYAILGHAPYTGVPRDTQVARTLFATDELTGFIFAVTYVRPSRSIHEVKPKSVTKKLKQSSFAAAINRAEVEQGIVELGVDRTDHIQFIIDALKEIDAEVGLKGMI